MSQGGESHSGIEECGQHDTGRVPALRALSAGRCSARDPYLQGGRDRQVHPLHDSSRQTSRASRHVSQPNGGHAHGLPVVMSTVRSARRWIQADRPAMGIDGRGLVIVSCLCAVVFACFFAIGRVVSPGSPPREAPLPGISVAAGGPAIPVRLSSAPPLEIGVAPSAQGSTRAGKVTVPVESVAAKAPESTSTTPAAQAPQTEASRSSSPAAPQPATPATPTRSPEHSKSAPGTGKSFDSSG